MPPLTWSISRDAVLHSCERRYYYQYLVNARYNSKNLLHREISLLKHLKSISSWQGDCFHSAVRRWANRVRGGDAFSLEQTLAERRSDMEGQWGESLTLVGQNLPATQVRCRIFEHEYGLSLPDGRLEAAIGETSRWVKSFFRWATDVHLQAIILRARKCWIEPDPFGPRTPGFILDGQQVVVKVDLALQSSTGTFEIWDWKTGKLREPNPRRINPAALQVNVYQLWPHLTLGVALENILAHLVYVAIDPVEDIVHEIDADVREYVASVVRRSIDRVQHFSGNAEVKLGIEDFDFALSEGYCRWCNFKRICARSLEHEDHRHASSSGSSALFDFGN
jgi:hypothetical protein